MSAAAGKRDDDDDWPQQQPQQPLLPGPLGHILRFFYGGCAEVEQEPRKVRTVGPDACRHLAHD